jgi:hypothetical protein
VVDFGDDVEGGHGHDFAEHHVCGQTRSALRPLGCAAVITGLMLRPEAIK